jgi:hypothetical protein
MFSHETQIQSFVMLISVQHERHHYLTWLNSQSASCFSKLQKGAPHTTTILPHRPYSSTRFQLNGEQNRQSPLGEGRKSTASSTEELIANLLPCKTSDKIHLYKLLFHWISY